MIADRNDVVEMSSLEFRNVLRAMVRDIDSQLSHYLNSSWIHTDRVGSRTQNLKLISSQVA
jgi:predicted pyridoxine 5'-phosphate oxidase superfamily flavin-nucleotide-binding protein